MCHIGQDYRTCTKVVNICDAIDRLYSELLMDLGICCALVDISARVCVGVKLAHLIY